MLAHAMGADFLEQDVVLTKDDVPIVMHDIQLETISDVAQRFPDRKRADGHYYGVEVLFTEAGIDGLFTDFSDVAVKWLGAHGP